MDGPTYRVSGVTTFFMVLFALIMDAAQGLFTLLVITAPLADLVTFIAAPMFGLWFLLLGVNFFSGKNVGAKVSSILVSTILELVPFINALPTITAGVLGVVWATRKEDKQKYEEQKKAAEKEVFEQARRQIQQQRIAQVANDRALAAANDT